jgi:chromosome segregation ATPase
MSEKDKGFSFRRLFIRDTEADPQDKQIQKGEPAVSKTPADFMANTTPNTPAGAQDQSLVEDFVQRLQNLINQNNQAGFDFLEFTESLFEEKQNPTPEIYKTVFRIAQKIDKSLTPARLLDSAMFYKDLVQRTAESEISKGTSKKQGLQAEKDTERNNLDNNLKDTRTKIQQLTRQIQELQNQDAALNNQLSAIDQKYESQFIDIERKISAIRNAKEQVLVSIVDIEAGIKSNLS